MDPITIDPAALGQFGGVLLVAWAGLGRVLRRVDVALKLAERALDSWDRAHVRISMTNRPPVLAEPALQEKVS